MAFMEGKLQGIDLLAALRAKRNLETDLESRRQKELQNQMLEQQLKEQEMKTNLIASPLSGWTPAQSPYSNFSPGYDKYKQQQDRNLAISQLTGQPLPNMGISGGYGGGGRGGYGGGGGGGTGGAVTENSAGGQVEVSSGGLGYVGPDHSKPVSVSTGPWPGTQAADGANNLGGGSMSGGGTYNEFSTNPTQTTGRIVDLLGNEAITGPAAAADYQSGTAGAETIKNILREREAAPGVQEGSKSKVLNQQASYVASDPRFKTLPSSQQKAILDNIESEVTNSIKTRGTPILNIAELISKYTK